MASTVTLAQLRDRTRKRALVENNPSVADSEITDLLNDSLAELYDLVLSQSPDQYVVTPAPTLTVTNGNDAYDLSSIAADFYKLNGVDVQLSASPNAWLTIKPFNFNERNKFNWAPITWNTLGIPGVRYHLRGTKLTFMPMPILPNCTARIWYTPTAPKMALDADTWDGINGWHEYAVLDAALKILTKRKEDTGAVERAKEAQRERIRSMAATRDISRPGSTTDVFAENSWPYGPEGW